MPFGQFTFRWPGGFGQSPEPPGRRGFPLFEEKWDGSPRPSATPLINVGGKGSIFSDGYRSARVAAMTALMVCRRFSASSKTMDCSLSKTSSVTSMAVRPNFSWI